jgi:hypothetical protein
MVAIETDSLTTDVATLLFSKPKVLGYKPVINEVLDGAQIPVVQ